MSKYGTFQSLLPKLHSSSIPGVFGREIIMKLKKLLMDSIYNGFQGFQLYYQPQFWTDSRKLYGAEALARFSCDELGSVPPDRFISILEGSGLIIPFGRWVFREAARQGRKWTERLQMCIRDRCFPRIPGMPGIPYIYHCLSDSKKLTSQVLLSLDCEISSHIPVHDKIHFIFFRLYKKFDRS